MPAMELAVENFNVESGANSNNGAKWKCIGADWLWQQLRSSEPQVTVLDCRSASDFSECHIRQAVHLSLPSIMLRRLAGGKVTISSVLKCTEARQQLAEAYGKHTFVLCGDLMSSERHPHEMLPVLHKSLVQDGCLVVCLEGKHLSLIFQPPAKSMEKKSLATGLDDFFFSCEQKLKSSEASIVRFFLLPLLPLVLLQGPVVSIVVGANNGPAPTIRQKISTQKFFFFESTASCFIRFSFNISDNHPALPF